MKPSAKEYRSTLDGKEAFLVRSLAQEGKTIFAIKDVSRLVGLGAKEVVRCLAIKEWVLPLKRGLYAIVPVGYKNSYLGSQWLRTLLTRISRE